RANTCGTTGSSPRRGPETAGGASTAPPARPRSQTRLGRRGLDYRLASPTAAARTAALRRPPARTTTSYARLGPRGLDYRVALPTAPARRAAPRRPPPRTTTSRPCGVGWP